MALRLHSPLVGTALVAIAMSALAVPLARLTAARHEPTTNPVETSVADGGNDPGQTARIAAILRIHAVDPLRKLAVTTHDGSVIAGIDALPVGESEIEVSLPWNGEDALLHVTAEGPDKETAVFLTLLPDGHEERTAYALGSGSIDEELAFDWHHHP